MKVMQQQLGKAAETSGLSSPPCMAKIWEGGCAAARQVRHLRAGYSSVAAPGEPVDGDAQEDQSGGKEEAGEEAREHRVHRRGSSNGLRAPTESAQPPPGSSRRREG